MRLVLSALILVGFSFGSAHADKKVDWSQYLEQPGDRLAKKTTPAPAAEPVKKKTKVSTAKQRPAKAAKRKPGRRR